MDHGSNGPWAARGFMCDYNIWLVAQSKTVDFDHFGQCRPRTWQTKDLSISSHSRDKCRVVLHTLLSQNLLKYI